MTESRTVRSARFSGGFRVSLPSFFLALGLTLVGAAPGGRVSYEKQVLPLLEEYCIDCHGDGVDKGDLVLDEWKSAEERDTDYHVWKEVLSNVALNIMPPPKRKSQPTPEERRVIETWIEREVFRYDPEEPDPGRVTVRRLNRQEYNNTVRDLFFVDFKPADDFPPDDSGYGFDNIGDVLSLSPVLLEKYMRAAEQITDAAIRADDPPKPEQRYSGNKLRGDGGMSGNWWSLSGVGKVGVSHEFPKDGEYLIRVRAAADQAGGEAAKMTLNVLGKKLHTFEVKNRRDSPQVFERRVKMKKGKHPVDVAFINDFYDPKAKDPNRRDRNLLVDEFEIVGPLGGGGGKLPEFHQKRLAGVAVTPANRLEVTHRILREFACRAYRRKVPEPEVERLMRFVKLGYGDGGKYAWERGMKLAFQAVLVSPFFLYRAEVQPEPNNPEATYRIDVLIGL